MDNSGFNRALGTCVVATVLAGCGAAQPPLIRQSAPFQGQIHSASIASHTPELKPAIGSPEYKITAPLIYATNVGNTNVTVYRANRKHPAPLATITDGLTNPFGACIDGQGTLYVTNEPASAGWVSVYPLGKTKPSITITAGINGPADCAIDGEGDLWIANAYGANVTEYLHGANKPHTVITKGLLEPVGIAFDNTGNLYVGNGPLASQQNVEVYAPGSKSPSRTITSGITSPCGLAIDPNGTLYVANVYQNNVTEYRSSSSDPYQTITNGMDHPEGVTVNKKGTLYVSNVGNGTILEFAPGSLTPLRRQISKGLYEPESVAYYPALLP